ncbi:MAG: aminotransferase class I/II-fold pyridoxal phosphate-dependent enzyme [SAR324 cluster bacterium]|nr:aminotransferase class I/II-fold pyridoxal phosphate-dependent enzyme [SAR324 cluster bacterium]MBL7035286.1 aminotransferase class I/II-fold pyridoxal phosphate-dependent enzyme [SAR324 cluster bacterium]
MKLENMTNEELQASEKKLAVRYQQFKDAGLKLDLTRGKPSTAQLDLADGMEGLLKDKLISESGTDLRNYGGLDGISEARKLGSEMLGLLESEVIAGDHSSLTLMYLYLLYAHHLGSQGPDTAWVKEDKVKFLAIVPGYDRHFSICEELGIQLVSVIMLDDGPDMDAVEELVRNDSSIKGMWCVPKYSNPTGTVYSAEVVERIAALGKIAGPNFRVMWDNAYGVHDLFENSQELANVMDYCRKHGTEDNLILTASTSKISYAGGGISFLGASEKNLKYFRKHFSIMSIGPNKLNQQRNLLFLKNIAGVRQHMQKHAEILRPKFAMVQKHLENGLAGKGMGNWCKPQGGYFVSFDALPGLAQKIVSLAGEAGVKLTPAGATFPYGQDPNDNNIRLAPTFPSVEDLDQAMQIFVTCVQLASIRECL